MCVMICVTHLIDSEIRSELDGDARQPVGRLSTIEAARHAAAGTCDRLKIASKTLTYIRRRGGWCARLPTSTDDATQHS